MPVGNMNRPGRITLPGPTPPPAIMEVDNASLEGNFLYQRGLYTSIILARTVGTGGNILEMRSAQSKRGQPERRVQLSNRSEAGPSRRLESLPEKFCQGRTTQKLGPVQWFLEKKGHQGCFHPFLEPRPARARHRSGPIQAPEAPEPPEAEGVAEAPAAMDDDTETPEVEVPKSAEMATGAVNQILTLEPLLSNEAWNARRWFRRWIR